MNYSLNSLIFTKFALSLRANANLVEMKPYRTICLAVFVFVFCGVSHAQRNTFGTSWGLSEIGISYGRIIKDNTFLLAGIHLETGEAFAGRANMPGAAASFTWNTIFARKESGNGNEIRFFAGPGAAAGYCKDIRIKKTEQGLLGAYFGLKGRLGLEIIYDRNVNIYVCVAPVLGLHLAKDMGGNLLARYYRYGLMQTIMPEIGISYRF